MSGARSSTATGTTGTADARPCGRFAPTPSGPLHLGSLLAAAGSYLSARSQGGRWLLRIDDLDRDRCIPGMADQFVATLAEFGFEWDGNVEFQSNGSDFHAAALARLQQDGHCYACSCSRSRVAALAQDPDSEPVYPGTCRDDPRAGSGPHAIRFHIDPAQPPVEFEDAWQGTVRQDCAREAGDFVIRRRDGFAAYHLAVTVDDARQGVTEVVRGADLLASTPRQILLQRALGLPTPRYGHLPLLTEPDGRKLAKSRRALPLSAAAASPQLWEVLGWLEQEPPAALANAPIAGIWAWAFENWRPERLVGRRERRLTAPPGAPAA
ncbi:MAG: tRNA glutamyl-Q(34) synthetase GluQRS [Steroidobacteraceae bacterium]|nr:tRNA glutamyl-Q(34) synthetase GluQRS [Steroidobacteraceae bacterium]